MIMFTNVVFAKIRLDVIINGALSKNLTIPSGVPQGSHIDPIFCLVINDIISAFKNKDCQLYDNDLHHWEKVYAGTPRCLDRVWWWCGKFLMSWSFGQSLLMILLEIFDTYNGFDIAVNKSMSFNKAVIWH